MDPMAAFLRDLAGHGPPAPPPPHMVQLRPQPLTVFGLPSSHYTIPILKSILSACGQRGYSYLNRPGLLVSVAALENTRTASEKRTIQHLLEKQLPITRTTILNGIQPVQTSQSQNYLSTGDGKGPLECEICAEEKERTEFPTGKITPTCPHSSVICKECLTMDIKTQMNDKVWSLLTCPVCSEFLPTDVVKQYTAPETFEKFNEFMVSWHMKDVRNFRWCHNPTCTSGQIYPSAQEKRVICYRCGAENCFHCLSTWHEGLSCKKAQKARMALLNPDEATQIVLATTTNVCPNCGVKVERNGGCQNMTCTCGEHFTWETPDSLASQLPPLLPSTLEP